MRAPSPHRPVLAVYGRWAATTPSPNTINLVYRATLTKIAQFEMSIVSICIARSRQFKSGIQLLVITSDFRIWAVEFQRVKPVLQPETLNIGRECCLGVCPGVTDCIVLDDRIVLLGPNSKSYEAPWPCDRLTISHNKHFAGQCCTLVCFSLATKSSCCSSTGSANISASHELFCSMTKDHEQGPILIGAQRSGQVFINKLLSKLQPGQLQSISPRLLVDVKEELCGVHFVMHEKLLGFVFISTSGKIICHPMNGNSTKYFRVSLTVNSSAVVAGSMLYLLSEGSLFLVNLTEASNDSRPCSSSQCIPLSILQSSLVNDLNLVKIGSSSCASNELVVLTSSNSLSHFDVTTDTPISPVWNCSIKSLMKHIRQISSAHGQMKEQSMILDRDLRAAQFAFNLQQCSDRQKMLLCSFKSSPIMQHGTAAVLLQFNLANKSLFQIPAGSFSVRFGITYAYESAFKTESLCLPLPEMASNQIIQTPMVCPILSPLPIKIKAALIYRPFLNVNYAMRNTRVIDLMMCHLDVLDLSCAQSESCMTSSIDTPSAPWISSLLQKEIKPAKKSVRSCKIRLAGVGAAEEALGKIAAELSPHFSRSDTMGKGSAELTTVSGSKLKVYMVISQPGLVDVFLHCTPGPTLPIWRASILSRFRRSLIDLSDWKTIAVDILPNMRNEFLDLQSSMQKSLDDVEQTVNGDTRKYAISSEDCSSLARAATTRLLSAYDAFRNKISQQLPL